MQANVEEVKKIHSAILSAPQTDDSKLNIHQRHFFLDMNILIDSLFFHMSTQRSNNS